MNGGILFALGAVCTWFGYACALRALYLWLKVRTGEDSSRPATIATVLAGVTLFAGSQITASQGFHIPLVWVVMPFSAWVVAVSVVFVAVRTGQALSALNAEEKRARTKSAIVWAIAAGLFVWFYRLDPTAQVLIVKGSIPLSVGTAIALVLLAVGSVAVMAFTARAAKARGIAKAFVIHLALIAGSVIFGLPLVWLVITSFKEDQ
ncbi:MAG TPA: hypothetical protein VMI31_18705, partial [Fimbriimonadaceae bacterium]|nr:hypothetical protein [Fimbriimonadaceae bacterium]